MANAHTSVEAACAGSNRRKCFEAGIAEPQHPKEPALGVLERPESPDGARAYLHSEPGFSDVTERPLLSVIVPVYNEAATIDEILSRVAAVPIDQEVIVVDDGSTDGTATLLDRWATRGLFLIVRHVRNRGKGMAIRSGLLHARGRYTVVQDADLEYDPYDYVSLTDRLLKGEADVAYGSRYLHRAGGYKQKWTAFRLGVCGLNLMVRSLYGVTLTDEATCLKVFPTAALRAMDLECERFEFCSEVTAKACRMGLRIQEVPVSYRPRSKSQGKKIRWRDGVWAAISLWKWRSWEAQANRS